MLKRNYDPVFNKEVNEGKMLNAAITVARVIIAAWLCFATAASIALSAVMSMHDVPSLRPVGMSASEPQTVRFHSTSDISEVFMSAQSSAALYRSSK